MKSIESTGKSVDEAIFNGLTELGISIDEVEVEIVQQESKGVFGLGAKLAKVKLTQREPEDIVVPDYMMEKGHKREDGGRGDRAQRSRGDRRDRKGGGERYADEVKQKYDYSLEAAEGTSAAEFVKGVLQRMGIEANVLAATNAEGIRLRIDSESMGRLLIGHRGETLDALQYLTALTVNRKEEAYTRITLDTEGYRDKREQTLERLAHKVASQVRSSGRPRVLEPMNPYERRVLHSTLQSHPYVTTHSEGEGSERRVIVEPKGRESRNE